MLIQWKDHRGWAMISTGILLVAGVTYVIYASSSPNGAHGGSVAGLIYGIVGTLMMVFAGLLAGRKRVPHWRLGSAKFWLKGHLWLGTLSFPLILFHAGFGWGGLLENILWVTFAIVVVSGFLGVALQHYMPRLLTSRVPYETFTAQLPYQCRRNQFLADRAVADLCGKLDVREDDFFPEFEKLAKFGAEATKDELQNWPDVVDQNWRGLFVDLSKTAKQNGWINQENNFPKMFADMYQGLDFKPPAKAKAAGKKGPSPLEQMKAKAAGGGAAADAKKKVSPLEQARKQAGQNSGDAAKPAKKKSPLELAREQAGGKAAGDAPAKKKSPLELAREQAAAKAAGDAEPAKKKSPLELAREQAKKKADGDEAPAKKKSPLELAREQAAAKNAGDAEPAKKKSPLELAREQAKKKADGDEAPAKKKSPLELAREQAAAKNAGSESASASRSSVADPGAMATLNFTADEMGQLARLAGVTEQFKVDEDEEEVDETLYVPCGNPECDYQLLIPNRSLLGRKARCPMCQKKFILRAPVEKDEEEEEEVLLTAGVVGVFEANQTIEIAKIEEERRNAASKRRESLSWDADESPLDNLDEPEEPKKSAATEPKKRLSPLELVRQQAAKATGNAPPPVKKAISKIEQMKAAVKAKTGGAGKPKPSKKAGGSLSAAGNQSIQIRGFIAPPKHKGPIVRSEHLKKFYLSRLRPFLATKIRSRKFPEFETEQSTSRMFNQLRAELPGELHGVLLELEEYATERRQFRTLSRIHKAMHTWLVLHIPISMALFVLVIVHIIVALRVVPPF